FEQTFHVGFPGKGGALRPEPLLPVLPFALHRHPPFCERWKGPEGISLRREIDDKPPGSFRKKSARGCVFMGNKQIKEIRFGKLGGSQSLFLSSRGARPFF